MKSSVEQAGSTVQLRYEHVLVVAVLRRVAPPNILIRAVSLLPKKAVELLHLLASLPDRLLADHYGPHLQRCISSAMTDADRNALCPRHSIHADKFRSLRHAKCHELALL